MNKDILHSFFSHGESSKSSIFFPLGAHVTIVFGPAAVEVLNSQHTAYVTMLDYIPLCHCS